MMYKQRRDTTTAHTSNLLGTVRIRQKATSNIVCNGHDLVYVTSHNSCESNRWLESLKLLFYRHKSLSRSDLWTNFLRLDQF